ncbi:MAG: methyltransferase domain-containing protein [Candidatus Anammoxibacter sp.]
MEIINKSKFYVPDYHEVERGDFYLFVDHETPNWIVTDKRGSQILNNIKQQKNIRELIFNYANDFNTEMAKAWMEVDSFIDDLFRSHFISLEPIQNHKYSGRADYIHLDKINELWIHTNNTCNLTCSHCLVDSSPDGDKGLSTDQIKTVIDSAIKAGTGRFYFTGGEPFLRNDIFDLIDHVCAKNKKELIILTNATLLKGNVIEKLKQFNNNLLRIQISLDGSTPAVNDSVRGKGSFVKAVEGIKNIVKIGFNPTVTTAVTYHNIDDVPEITKLLGKLGIKTQHLLWVHKRGRAVNNGSSFFIPVEELINVTRKVKDVAGKLGISVDNLDSYKFRANSPKGTRYDLGNACYDSMCIYSNGDVYPSAAFAGYEKLKCGNILEDSFENIWKNSPITKAFRNATLQNKEKCSTCYIKFICGGGDIEHSFFYSPNGFKLENDCFPKNLGVHALDPYCELHQELIKETIFELAESRRKSLDRNTGFNAPIVLRSMGEGVVDCGLASVDSGMEKPKSAIPSTQSHSPIRIQQSVRTLHSNCVLSFDVDKPRKSVRDFYGNAAEVPQEDLCCPTKNAEEDTSHIPQEVLDRFYGCGSPITIANVSEGETVVDLGSGAGIDCFIAAKKVGATGKIFGIDMTDEMLKVANSSNKIVAKNLGYDVVGFKKGFLEDIPVDDNTVDLITSNCVINLSPDKKSVFGEMWRILKDHGRIVISDIVSLTETPAYLRANKRLWGECISGSLTEDEFIAYLEQVGFYGIQTLHKVFWKEVEGYPFYSVTVRGYKFEKKEGCVYSGQKAIYNGPLKAVMDEEGHLFPRNKAIEICTDTAAKLNNLPYAGQFTIVNPQTKNSGISGCCTTKEGAPCC